MSEDIVLRSPSSSVRYGQGRTTAREVLGYASDEQPVATRASRPGPITTGRRPMPHGDVHTADLPHRSVVTKVQPTQARRKTYIPDEKPLPNRQRRRLDLNKFHPMFWVGLTFMGLLILYYLGSLAYDAWVLGLSDPAMYGPAHGNVVEVVDNGQFSYAHGINDHGHIEIIVIPEDAPQKARIYLGPQHAPTNMEVELEVEDLNGDGHPDIIEHLEGNPSSLFFPRPELKSYDWISNGKGDYTLEP